MSVDMTTERLAERGKAILAWEAAAGDVDALARVDRRCRRGLVTDWPGRDPGPEVRNGIPDLDLPDRDPEARRCGPGPEEAHGAG
jgi:hypothetical protein